MKKHSPEPGAAGQEEEQKINDASMEGERSTDLHIVMMPWLAMGHLFPFFELSKRLASKGLRVSFLASPGNLRRLPLLPPSLSHLLHLVPCPLPSIESLPTGVESTVDLPSDAVRPFLTQAYCSFEQHLDDFLSDPVRPKPDWIIYDMIANQWVPTLAARHGVGCACFSLFNAAILSFFGRTPGYDSPEELTVVPDWIPFSTSVVFRPFEAQKIFSFLPKKKSPSSSSSDQDAAARRGNSMLIRTCTELEPDWLDILSNIHGEFPVIPVGFLPPSFQGDADQEKDETWVRIAGWLDTKGPGSVVFAAFGSEVKLTGEQIEEIALGLERSGVPFVWALRAGEAPAGFEERVAEHGLVVKGWVPQVRVLAHGSVGGFLTHGGWNSIVEGLAAGVAMVVLPMQFEQGPNARLLEEKGLGVEVVRGYDDGAFDAAAVARKLRLVMVEEDGEVLRQRAREGKGIFGAEEVQGRYLGELLKYLSQKKAQNQKDVENEV